MSPWTLMVISLGGSVTIPLHVLNLWWLCGDRKLRVVLPQSWQGSCALVQLLMPFYIYPTTAFSTLPERLKHHPCQKREAPALDNSIYIDAVGVPRGVPDEFKARNQIAAVSIAVAAALITTCGCCLIPCASGLLCFIDSAITKVVVHEAIASEESGYVALSALKEFNALIVNG
ncbi:hypothetical protein MHYP_G00251060 [Metynnis hypsauchen]